MSDTHKSIYIWTYIYICLYISNQLIEAENGDKEMNVSSVLSAGSSVSRSGVKCIYETVGEKSYTVTVCSWGVLNFIHSFAPHLETQMKKKKKKSIQAILSFFLIESHSGMWEGRQSSLVSGCLAYQHPEADVVTSLRKGHKLMKSVGNAEHFVLGVWALNATVNNKLAVPCLGLKHHSF